MKNLYPLNKNALRVAIISFSIGTIILLAFLVTGSSFLVIIGLYYVMLASIINSITLIGLIINAILQYQHYKEHLSVIGLFILNVPIAIGYFLIVANNPFHNINL